MPKTAYIVSRFVAAAVAGASWLHRSFVATLSVRLQCQSMDAKTVKRIRQQVGLTQVELAESLGVHRVTVAKWETGALPVPRMAAILLRQWAQLRTR